MPATRNDVTRSVFARISRLAASLRIATVFLEVVVVLLTIAGVGLGLLIALKTGQSPIPSSYGSYYSTNTTHPYVATGTGIMIAALLAGLFYWCIARAMHLFAEHIAAGHKVDLAYRREAFLNENELEYATGAAHAAEEV